MSEEDIAEDPVGYGFLNVDEMTAFNWYGGLSIVAIVVPPLIYNLLLRGTANNVNLLDVGYKFAAYTHFYLFLPVALSWFVLSLHKTKASHSAMWFFSNFSMSGPFLLFPIACYFLFYNAIRNIGGIDFETEWYDWLGAALFTSYNIVAIVG